MRYCLIICVAAVLIGCFGSRPPAPFSPNILANSRAVFVHPEAPPLKKGETAIDQASDNLAFWEARLKVEKDKALREKKEERARWLETICRWVIGICFLGVLANVALFILSFKFDWFGNLRNAAMAGVAANLVIICLVWYIPGYIGYVAGIVVAGAGITAIGIISHAHGLGREVRNARQSASEAATALVKKIG